MVCNNPSPVLSKWASNDHRDLFTLKWPLKRKAKVITTINLNLDARSFSLCCNNNYCCCFCFSLISNVEPCGLWYIPVVGFSMGWMTFSIACALHRPDAGQHGRLWATGSVLPRESAGHPVDEASTPASEAPEAWRKGDADDTVTGRHRPQDVCAHSQRNERSRHVIGPNVSQDSFSVLRNERRMKRRWSEEENCTDRPIVAVLSSLSEHRLLSLSPPLMIFYLPYNNVETACVSVLVHLSVG